MKIYGIYRVDQKPAEDPWDTVVADGLYTTDNVFRLKKGEITQACYPFQHFYITLLEEL